MYNVEDGWLNDYMPEVIPEEGTMVEMNWKFILKGGMKFTLSTMVQIHQNAKGQVVVDLYKSKIDCNE
jgi:agmatine/peptidylarginine deiminase